MPNKIFYAFLNSSLGKIGIASSSSGIVCVDIGIKENAFLRYTKTEISRKSAHKIRKEKQSSNR